MTQKEKMVAVFIEQEEVLHVFPEWPRDMRLIVCMEESGECQLLIYRQEERGAFPERLLKNFDLQRDELCVHPPVVSYASRQILYTEECGLASLIADAPEIVERAQDYSMNYSYALEEGLDPEKFIDSESAEDTAEEIPDVPLQFVRRSHLNATSAQRSSTNGNKTIVGGEPAGSTTPVKRPSVRRSDKVLVPQVAADTQVKAAEDPIDFYEVLHDQDNWVTLERDKKGGFDLLVIDQEQIEWRQDRKLLALQVTADWQKQSGLPKRVRIYLDKMPASVAEALCENDGKAGLTSDGAFLYLKLSKKPKQPVQDVANGVSLAKVIAEKPIMPLAAPQRPLVAPKRNVSVGGFLPITSKKTRGRAGYAGAFIVLAAAALTFGYLQLSGAPVESVKNVKLPTSWSQGGDLRGSG